MISIFFSQLKFKWTEIPCTHRREGRGDYFDLWRTTDSLAVGAPPAVMLLDVSLSHCETPCMHLPHLGVDWDIYGQINQQILK